jgi:hypothetical protein
MFLNKYLEMRIFHLNVRIFQIWILVTLNKSLVSRLKGYKL